MTSKIRSLEYVQSMPELTRDFEIIDRKGQGTFASVFTVKSKYSGESTIYALKMIVPTVDLRRVENEIRCLRQLQGKHGVIQMVSAMRIRDHVFILMPFVDYIAFSNYYLSLNEKEIRRYLLHLLRALEHVHRFGIIHRDIKPTNFLLDRHTRKYTLVDFGLAHSQSYGDLDSNWDPFAPSQFNPMIGKSKRLLKRNSNTLSTDDFCSPAKISRIFARSVRVKSTDKLLIKEKTDSTQLSSNIANSSIPSSSNMPTRDEQCGCGNRLAVCRGCRNLSKEVNARRGGTLGFRPPEVMFRCVQQTIAIDLWAVGVIFLSFLTGRYPFIKVDEDLEVAHAFTHLLGYERMQIGAHGIGKRFLVDPKPPPLNHKETSSMYLKKRLVAIRKSERRLVLPPPPLLSSKRASDISCEESAVSYGNNLVALPNTFTFPSSAYDLVTRLLEPHPAQRITASEAIQHPYIRGGLLSKSNEQHT